jgi:error-prone DNA polymerase
MKHRQSPHRFGRQSRVNEHPREVGEPSQRIIDREAKGASHDEPSQHAAERQTPPIDRVAMQARSHRNAMGGSYAELHCLSNFSFQRGASSAEELFTRAKKLGYSALAITDECSLAGIVRAHEASKETGIALIVGTEIRLADGPKLVVLAADHGGYSDICRLITTGRRRSAKGEYHLTRADAEELGSGVCVLWTPESSSRPGIGRAPDPGTENIANWIMQHFAGRAWLAVELHHGPDDDAQLVQLRGLGKRHGLPLVAAGDVHMHVRRRRALQDVMTAIRLGCTVAAAGHALSPNGERHLRHFDHLAAIYPPDLIAETLRIAARCTFNLEGLDYRYPKELVPQELNGDANAYLRRLTCAGAARLWPAGIPQAVQIQVEKELALIAGCRYEHFFLTVEDIVRWARAQDPPILCQGRGSSANSAVCYCLGITSVTPENGNLLFERFVSKERDEPPDIDVDFEHERREEVIQYVFGKYGRHRAALAATVISYRSKSALRDVGHALGLTDDALDQLSAISTRVPNGLSQQQSLRERGFDPDSRVLRQLMTLAAELRGFPRHLSQHVGGFVISDQPLHHLVPVENAAMPDRTIIQWDKDDLETMKLLKVDCLALGMLTCLRKCIDLLHAHGLWSEPYTGAKPALHDIPQHDDKVYDMICKADTVGVFQVESRAQMSMLPRLRPRCFYDLVIEVAIVRPGPIQGNMVHPYLRRRKGQEPVDYPQSKFERESGTLSSKVKEVLERTLGVPIFQEQVMKLIQVVAGFTPGEADQLRRAMAAWKRRGGLEKFHDRILDGMRERGYSDEYFERIFEQIKGFGDYGFPESHAASFARLAWASCWLKHYHPAAFTCALLNSQPMGFYQPAQLIQDAQRHSVRVLPVDVTVSDWDCALELLEPSAPGSRGKPSPQSLLGGEGWVRGQRGDVRETQDSETELISMRRSGLRFTDSLQLGATPSPQPSPPTMEPLEEREFVFALRLGLRQIKGISETLAQRIVAARSATPFRDVADLVERARINAGERAHLANAGALNKLSGHRHRARWDSAGAELPLPMLAGAAPREANVALRPPSLREDVMTDYATLGLSLTLHPLALIRPALARRRVVPARTTTDAANHGRRLRCAGLVTVRQHPGTAKGVTFVTLEDETGYVNVVVWRALAERQHRVLVESAVMCVDGKLEAHEGVHHLIADRLHDYSALLPEFAFASRDFH